MHPILFSSRSFSIVVVLWSVVCCFGAALVSVQANVFIEASAARLMVNTATLCMPWYALLLFICMSNFYICLRMPLKSTQLLTVFTIQALGACVAISIWLLLGYLWAQLITTLSFDLAQMIFNVSLFGNIAVAGMFYAFWVLLHYVFIAAQDGGQERHYTLAQKLLVSEVELQAIKATLHPHFLYNSLNMLANLSLVEPEKIHSLCIQMSDFLRYSVSYGNKKHVSLAEEVQHISNYLHIERERFGARLNVDIDVSKDVSDTCVFPLLLFPLVENAIKHGVDSSFETSFVAVNIFPDGDKVILRITNSLELDAEPASGTHHGLASLAKRLRSHFGDAASITIKQKSLQFEVILEIPRAGLRNIRGLDGH